MVYLDNNATTPIAPEVVEAMIPYFKDTFFNPSSLYSQAKESRYALEAARKQIAEFIGAKNDSEIIFTGCASESNNAAIKGALAANPDRKHLITTNVEHPAVYELAKDLERNGYEITLLEVDENGEINIKDLIDALRPQTAVVSIMHANNETGVIFPIQKISRVVKMTDQKIVFHTDATQTVGKIPINLQDDFPYVDMLTFSGHKLHAPKGIGVLYNRAGTRWRPMIIGGHQERGRRAGTENVAYIVGLAKACQLAKEYMAGESKHTIKYLRDELEAYIEKNIPGIKINGQKSPRLHSTTNISFEAIEGESIVYALDEEQICVATGSACSSGSLAPSHVLQAMKVPFSFAHGSIRFSFGRYNSSRDLKKVIEVLPGIISRLREISPFWNDSTNQAVDFAKPE